jgi:hypothetical protein
MTCKKGACEDRTGSRVPPAGPASAMISARAVTRLGAWPAAGGRAAVRAVTAAGPAR